jgi:branched-chain amino acid transport system permease protein
VTETWRHGLAVLALLGLLTWWSQAEYFGFELLAEIAVFAILAISLDLIAGYAGMVSLGHAALFGTGAYIYAWLGGVIGTGAPLAMLGATVGTGLVALVVGAVAVRVEGIFFIMITLGFGQMGYEFFFQNSIMGGDDGFFGIPRLDLSSVGIDLTDPANFALFALMAMALLYVLLAWLLTTPFGAVLRGLHANPKRFRALGLRVLVYRTAGFGVAGAVAGFAGSLSAQHTLFIAPNLLNWTTSGEVLVMVILGGLGTLVGPLIGAASLVFLKHELSGFTDYWGAILGGFLILVVLSRQNGLVGALTALAKLAKPAKSGSRDA